MFSQGLSSGSQSGCWEVCEGVSSHADEQKKASCDAGNGGVGITQLLGGVYIPCFSRRWMFSEHVHIKRKREMALLEIEVICQDKLK